MGANHVALFFWPSTFHNNIGNLKLDSPSTCKTRGNLNEDPHKFVDHGRIKLRGRPHYQEGMLSPDNGGRV